MDEYTARFLTSTSGREAVESVTDFSMRALTDLRKRFAPELAAAITAQAELRDKAAVKLGDTASDYVYTGQGLEQISRLDVSKWRARRLVAAGIERVVDIGCGLGFDSLAFTRAGLKVTAIEKDPATAILAAANVPQAEVITADATAVVQDYLTSDPKVAVFCDPARRTDRGRSWRVADFSPGWDFVTWLIETERLVNVKLGPGVPYRILPPAAQTIWISHRSDTVEASLWTGSDFESGRQALLLPENISLPAGEDPPVGPVGGYLYEPNGAAIRAGAVGVVAANLQAWALQPNIAYLSSFKLRTSPWATAYRIESQLPFRLAAVRAYIRDKQIGRVEIKKRGVELDPASWRRQLRPKGPNEAILIVTPTSNGTKVLAATKVDG